jgi:glycosyltransferase involved in cell wall biosynthesis
MRIVFLYTELADYIVKCFGALAKVAEVHVIRWPVNKEAPFAFEFPENVTVYNKADYDSDSLEALVKKLNPGMLVCSGWIDATYLRIVRGYKKKIPTVLTCDTQWKGSLKQLAATLIGRVALLPFFSYCWVPGDAQLRYMRKMGFRTDQIKRGFYCCDLYRFNGIYEKQFAMKKNNLPRRLVYAGRYYQFKGIEDLWSAFIELQHEGKYDWELWCMGTGDLEPARHPRIKHLGFVQPPEMQSAMANSAVFVLPSRYEPWGVVVHEFAAAGFPLLLSTAVGAKEAFLLPGQNGHLFQQGNKRSLKEALKKVMDLDDKELLLMSQKSHELAQSINPEQWVATAVEMYNEKK